MISEISFFTIFQAQIGRRTSLVKLTHCSSTISVTSRPAMSLNSEFFSSPCVALAPSSLPYDGRYMLKKYSLWNYITWSTCKNKNRFKLGINWSLSHVTGITIKSKRLSYSSIFLHSCAWITHPLFFCLN